MAASSVPSDKLRLVLVSAEAELLDTLCDEVTLPGREGDLGILPGHAAFLGTLQPGVLRYRKDGQEHRVAVSGGFGEVFEGGVRVLVDHAIMAADVDSEQVRSQLNVAQKRADEPAEPESLLAAQDEVRALEAQLELVN